MFSTDIVSRVESACQRVSTELMDQRNESGYWTGELSSSALATATAISAVAEYRTHSVCPVVKRAELNEMIDKGCRWLLNQQNEDGGWGDTDQSHSNVATSMLAVAALTLSGKLVKENQADDKIAGTKIGDENFADQSMPFQQAVDRANLYIDRMGRVAALRKRYGKDKTFAVPILANCAIAGLVPWKEVSALPFEAVLVPQKFYRFINLPVVSYAIPALVAIGQLKFLKDPPWWNPGIRLLRKFSLKPGLATLEKIQPASGGFLEAIPLTCFVAMSLAHSGRADHEVVKRCIMFVMDSFREDDQTGTWPIDTNLATWNTTLAINALAGDDDDSTSLSPTGLSPTESQSKVLTPSLLDWVLSCQYTEVHPFTGASPGGWGWSDLSGAVPDADDTPGALLAIRKWYDNSKATSQQREKILVAAKSGVGWLLDLQNRDKGWPTFCRGWGRLPFDRSGNDLTAHVIRALVAWQVEVDDPRIQPAIENGFAYLRKHTRQNGGWLPLWFGNQDHPEEENPIYGTVKVLLAWIEAGRGNDPAVRLAVEWLLKNQNDDFGWGGGPSNANLGAETGTSSLQETSLVVEGLVRILEVNEFARDSDVMQAVSRGTEWMLNAIDSGKTSENWPIGFYFAKLWYYENLYPKVFCTSTMQCLRRFVRKNSASSETSTSEIKSTDTRSVETNLSPSAECS